MAGLERMESVAACAIALSVSRGENIVRPALADFYERYWTDTAFAALVIRWQLAKTFVAEATPILDANDIRNNPQLADLWSKKINNALKDKVSDAADRAYLADPRRNLLTTTLAFFRMAIGKVQRAESVFGTPEERELLAAAGLAAGGAFGTWFENAVQWRFLSWLRERPDIQKVISEVAVNVPLGASAGELDIAILLKNAVAIHLECKSAPKETKDVESQTMKLHTVAGNVAQQYLVIPGHSSDDPEHAETFLRQKQELGTFEFLERWKGAITIIRFTLDPVGHDPGVAGKDPSFERSLDRVFASYLPRV